MAVYTLAMLSAALEVAMNVKGAKVLVTTSGESAPLADDRKSERWGRIAIALTSLAFALHFAGVIARGISAHRVPWGNMYEFSTTGSVAVTGMFLLLLRRHSLRWLTLVVTFAVLMTLGTAITLLYVPTAPLVPALKSTWLVIHVSAAVISGGVFLLANAVAGAYLYLDRVESRGPRPSWALKIPSLEALDRLCYRLVAFVFPLWTFAVIAGAIWAESAWGRYWGWDPKETWAFITWVAYAAYLHARSTAGWKGRRAAWLCLLAGSSFLFNYVYVNVWGSGKHTYSGL
ncbi:MAG: c-type cytochrome biogenesis protein CcsB [Actinobacteria bacterium]|nr:c-type cytochrome biogenesis protein CcsB [Actinomycetota bacterium]MSY27166.1 c-type cytochrome biogenesis protein CcsB [Actinomycetota bacterium]MSZ86603.1 c-type cytochrome biogenesis protein CcsB [Actinomycetota bacterium]